MKEKVFTLPPGSDVQRQGKGRFFWYNKVGGRVQRENIKHTDTSYVHGTCIGCVTRCGGHALNKWAITCIKTMAAW